jgi:WD40 repeat protein/tRNA A-37 threonylcarbamoyl transferase component Bud32
MKAEQPETRDDDHVDQLASGDDALAAGQTPEALVDREGQPLLQRDLAYLQRLRRALRRPDKPPPSAADDSLPSSLGRFRICRELGRGGCGVVFLADDPLLGREVALKVPRPEMLLTAELRERFRREARAAAGLDHPNVVPVYEVGEVGPLCFLVSAYCPGVNLADWLRRRSEPVPFRTAAGLLVEAARGVGHAHERGVVHRDLKPSNLLLSAACGLADMEGTARPQAARENVKITDFGLAKLLEADSSDAPTRTGTVLGTPSYMAPEQAAGQNSAVGPAADVYALGAILYELLTGRPPFKGETDLDTLVQVRADEPVPPCRLRPRLPGDLETICLKALQKDPARRYASAALLAADLSSFLAGEPIHARPVGRLERLGRWARRHPARAAAAILAGVALLALTGLGVAAAFTVRLHREQEQTRAALDEAERQRALADHLSASLALERGLNLCEQGEVSHGLTWLAHSLRLAQPQDDELQQACRANLAGWAQQVHPLVAVLPHDGPVRAVQLSPDGKTVLAGSEGNSARLWDLATGRPLGGPLRHRWSVQSVAFCPDGRTVATASLDGDARLWDATTGSFRHDLPHGSQVLGLAFNRDGQTLVTGCRDGQARLWSTARGQEIRRLDHEGRRVYRVLFSPDDRTVLTGCGDGTVHLWDAATGRRTGQPEPHRRGEIIRGMAFSHDGQRFATASEDETAHLYEQNGKLLGVLRHQGGVMSVAFSPDDSLVATASQDGTARLWDAATGEPRGRPLRHPNQVYHVAFQRNAPVLVTAGADRTARLWDTVTGAPIGNPLIHRDGVWAARITPDGRHVVTGSYDGNVRVWEVARGRPLTRTLPHEGPVRAVAFSPDGRLVATASVDKTARLWRTATGQPLKLLRHQGRVEALAFSPNGKTLLTGSYDRTAQLWEIETGKPLLDPAPQHKSWVLAVAFHPRQPSFVTASLDTTARIWHADTGKLLGRPLQHRGNVERVVFSPDGKVFATVASNHRVGLWNALTFKALPSPPPLSGYVYAVAFSPDSRRLASACQDRNAQVWDVATGKPGGPPLPHEDRVLAVAFSPDGRSLVTGCADGTAWLWDLDSWQPRGAVLRHEDRVVAVAYRPDGRTVVTASEDRTARLWDATDGRSLGLRLRHGNRVGSVAFSPDGQVILTGSGDATARLWEPSPPLRGEVEQIVQWAQVITGLEMTGDKVVRVLDAAAWRERRERLRR